MGNAGYVVKQCFGISVLWLSDNKASESNAVSCSRLSRLKCLHGPLSERKSMRDKVCDSEDMMKNTGSKNTKDSTGSAREGERAEIR